MRILLHDADSKIPNLALMKLAAFHERKGDEVGFHVSSPELIYISCIFRKNAGDFGGFKWFHPSAKVILGGSGISLESNLPPEVEHLMPEYSIYPDCDSSYGYTSRGCNRNCYFCVVPRKEGKFRVACDPSEFYNDKFSRITFLDNNILLDPAHFNSVCDFCIERDLSLWFTQGFDVRLLTPEIAAKLRDCKTFKTITFAYDWDNLEPVIREKCKILTDAGFNLRGDIMFYVYVTNDAQFDSGLKRCNILRELGTNAFVMYNFDVKRPQRVKDLQRWANRKQLFWKMEFKDYKHYNSIE